MPHVHVTWLEGRTPEQKRKVAEGITKVLEEAGNAKREAVHIAFIEIPPTNFADAGVLLADRKKSAVGARRKDRLPSRSGELPSSDQG